MSFLDFATSSGGGGILSGLLSLPFDIANTVERNKQNKWQQQFAEKQFQFQQDQFAYTKQLQQQLFDREDRAVQRRVNDMEKAGFNPLSAIAGKGAGGLGGGAAAGQGLSAHANPIGQPSFKDPFESNFGQNFVDNMYKLRRQQNENAMAQSQIELNNQKILESKSVEAKNIAESDLTKNKKNKFYDKLMEEIDQRNKESERRIMTYDSQRQMDLFNMGLSEARQKLFISEVGLNEAKTSEVVRRTWAISHEVANMYIKNSIEAGELGLKIFQTLMNMNGYEQMENGKGQTIWKKTTKRWFSR